MTTLTPITVDWLMNLRIVLWAISVFLIAASVAGSLAKRRGWRVLD